MRSSVNSTIALLSGPEQEQGQTSAAHLLSTRAGCAAWFIKMELPFQKIIKKRRTFGPIKRVAPRLFQKKQRRASYSTF